MEVSDLLTGLETEAAKSQATLDWLTAELAGEQRHLLDIRREIAAVGSALQRLSGSPPASAPADTSWRGLTHVDTVEAALREAGHPLHLSEIANALATHGHVKLPKAKVSATLTHLSQVRGSVVNVGKGRWDFVRPKLDPRIVAADDTEKLPSQGSSPDLAIPEARSGSPIA